MTLGDDAIEVTGTGAASTTPDLVLLDVRLQQDADSVADALNAVSEATATMLGHARSAAGFRSAATQGIGVHQRHDNTTGLPIRSYTAYSTVRVEVLGADQVGDLIPRLARSVGDALSIDNLSLGVAEPAPLMVRAREAAFGDARARAEQYAALAGRPLGAVLSVQDTLVGGLPGPAGREMAMAKDVGGAMPVESGAHTVTASVTVRWALGSG